MIGEPDSTRTFLTKMEKKKNSEYEWFSSVERKVHFAFFVSFQNKKIQNDQD